MRDDTIWCEWPISHALCMLKIDNDSVFAAVICHQKFG